MFEQLNDSDAADESAIALLLEALDKSNRRDEERQSVRKRRHANLVIAPGNLSDRSSFEVEATTLSVSDDRCRAISDRALLPGDLFALVFDEQQLSAGTVIGQCVRCSMLRPGAFELAFAFLQTIDVESTMADARP